MSAYQFQPGTIPHAAWLHLKTLPPGAEICTAELAEAIHQPGVKLGPYLVTAVQHGALASRKVGKLAYWSVGAGTPLVRGAVDGEDDEEEPAPQRLSREVSNKPLVASLRKPTLRTAAPVPAPMRVALWSDGTLQIERGPDDVVLLTADETKALVRYLDRLATQEAVAP